MPIYGFRAMTWNGGVINGYMFGASKQHVRQRLYGQHSSLLSISRAWYTPMSQRTKSRFFVYLSHALQAGCPLVQALDMTMQSCGRNAWPMIESLRDHVAQGHVLSQSLALHPEAFSEVVRARIVVGEQTGHLITACHDVHIYLEAQHQRHQQWAKALIYPLLNGVVLVGVLGVLSATLIPEIMGLAKDSGRSTSLTLTMIQTLCHPLGIVAMIALLGVLWLAGWTWPHRIPWLRLWVAQQQYSTFFSGVALLLKAHVPLFQALSIMSRHANTVPQENTLPLLEALTQGQSLHNAVQKWPFFQPLHVSYIHIGEQTGQLLTSLDLLVRCLDETLQQRRDRLITWTTPCLLLVMGMVLWLVLDGTMMPLYDVWVASYD